MMYESESMVGQLMSMMDQVNEQIQAVNEWAVTEGVPASQLKYTDGKWILNDLLHTKAMVLSSMVLLEEQINRETTRITNLKTYIEETEDANKIIRRSRGE